jgi:hypothetical protein
VAGGVNSVIADRRAPEAENDGLEHQRKQACWQSHTGSVRFVALTTRLLPGCIAACPVLVLERKEARSCEDPDDSGS